MGAVLFIGRRIIEEENRNEMDRRSGYIEGIMENEWAVLALKNNVANTNGMYRFTTKPVDGMGSYGAKGLEVRSVGGNVASSTTVENKGVRRERYSGMSGKGSGGMKRIGNGETGMIWIVKGFRNFSNKCGCGSGKSGYRPRRINNILLAVDYNRNIG